MLCHATRRDAIRQYVPRHRTRADDLYRFCTRIRQQSGVLKIRLPNDLFHPMLAIRIARPGHRKCFTRARPTLDRCDRAIEQPPVKVHVAL